MAWLTILSFGYLHEVPEATVTVDVREILRDPHIDPALRNLTAYDPAVRAKVAATVGAEELARDLTALARTLSRAARPRGRTATLAIGCAGGRHRSAALAMTIAENLGFLPPELLEVRHLHIDRPVVQRPTPAP